MRLKHIIIVIIAISSLSMVFNAQAESIQDDLITMVNTINKQLPMTIDKETRWDSSVAMGKKVIYLYTLINFTAKQLSKTQVTKFTEIQTKTLVNNYCTLPAMAVFKNNAIKLDYTYRGKEGKHIITIPIAQTDCIQ